METREVNDTSPQKIPNARDVASTESRNRAETMKIIRGFFESNTWLYAHFRNVAVYPDKWNRMWMTVSFQHGTDIMLQLPATGWLVSNIGALPIDMIVTAVRSRDFKRSLSVMKIVRFEDLEEYLKLFAHLDTIRWEANKKNKILKFIPRTLTIEDTDGLVYMNLGQIPLSPKELFDIIEQFFYISSNITPLPKKYDGKKV